MIGQDEGGDGVSFHGWRMKEVNNGLEDSAAHFARFLLREPGG